MDWANVTAGEVLSSMQEVDWNSAPKDPTEFLGKFSLPGNRKKLEARLKCNTYYYRANYLVLLILVVSVAFLRRPSAFLGLLSLLIAGLCLNNTFAQTSSNTILKGIRRVHVPTAQKLRSLSGGHAGLGKLVVAGLFGIALFLLLRKGALWHLFMTLLIAFRVPNLKTRLSSAREEFRAVWRGYQAEHDFLA